MNAKFGEDKLPGEQQSIEWLQARVGHVTASRFRDVLDKLKSGKPGAKRSAYLWEVVCERLTGKPADHYASAAMQWGTDNEPEARMAYEAATGSIVVETGFHHHPMLPLVGGSPDGFVDDDGGIEIKCPFNSAVHLQTIINGMPEEHMAQIQGCMWITGRAWWDFVSFDWRMPESHRLYVQRTPRDQAFIDALQLEVISFLQDVDSILEQLGIASKRPAVDAV